MEWYEILGLIVFVLAGVWLRGKVYDVRKYHGYNGSWRKRKENEILQQ